MKKEIAKIFLVVAFLITISACDRRNCENVVCPVNQGCNNGQCYCGDGYEGTNCDINSYEKYIVINNYAYESCNTPPPFTTTNVYITWDGVYINQVHIHNLMGSNCPDVIAIIRTDANNEGNILEINEQTCGGSSVSGQGTYDKINHRVNLQLYYNVSGTGYSCNTILQ